MRRLFFALLLVNLVYAGWALWVTPPPTVPVNEALARLPQLKLLSEVSLSEPHPQASPRPLAQALSSCLSLGPFSSLDNSATAAAILKQKGFDPKQRAAEGDAGAGYWVFVAVKSEGESDKALANLEKSGVKDALVMPASADAGRRISLGLFTERSRADKRAELVKGLGLAAEVAERKIPNTVYWVDLETQGGTTAVPLQDLFYQGVSTKVSVQPCPAPAAAPAPVPTQVASAPASPPVGTPQP